MELTSWKSFWYFSSNTASANVKKQEFMSFSVKNEKNERFLKSLFIKNLIIQIYYIYINFHYFF